MLVSYIPMQEVTPKVVAMAVRMVMAICMIFWMISFLFMAFGVMSFEFFSPPSSCHSEERSDEDELLRACPKNLEYVAQPSPLRRG